MSQQRTIDVRKQRNLTPRETFHLCVKGIRHRLLRSVLTLAVVVLAVAFFMFLLTESMILRSVGRGVGEELEQGRVGPRTMTRLFVKPTDPVLVRRLSRALRRQDEVLLNEAAAVTGWPLERVLALVELADRERLYSDFINGLPTGRRLALVQKRTGREALEYIRDHREQFRADIAPMVDIRIPGQLPSLEAFLDVYGEYRAELAAFAGRWNERIEQANRILARHKAGDDRPDTVWVAEAAPDVLEAWRADLAELGFAFGPAQLEAVRSQLAQARIRNDLLARLNSADMRSEWTRAFRERRRTSADEKLLQLDDPRAAGLFEGEYDPETLRVAAERARVDRRLAVLERRLQPVLHDDVTGGLTARQIFLLGISFVVCMVGIANAMLMSITERFREIATMKCLGATDRYILLQFMMEAALQGVFGGVLGVGIGFAITVARDALVFGAHLFRYWPGLDLLASGVFSLVIGVVLAVLASIHPSWSASRMAPMEAMRIE